MKTLAFAVGLCMLVAAPAQAELLTDFALFGNNGVTLSFANVNSGLVGSNGGVTINPLSTVQGLRGGGSLTVVGSTTVNGPVTFNGNVTLGNFITVTGPVNAGGNVTTEANTGAITAGGNVTGTFNVVNGNVLANGNFTGGAFTQVLGDVGANGNVTIASGFSVYTGSVTHGGTFAGDPTRIPGGVMQGLVSVNPVAFVAVPLPPADSFSAGGALVLLPGFTSTSLAPGSYGQLIITGAFNTLTLTAGDYFFTSIVGGGAVNFNLDLSGGPINLFVTGNVTLGTFTTFTINGQPFASADPSLASQVFLETLGGYTQGQASDFFGTIFAPNGNIVFGGFTRLTGSAISGNQVVSSGSVTVNHVASDRFTGTVIPEPSTLVLAGLGVVGLGGWTWRRRGRLPNYWTGVFVR